MFSATPFTTEKLPAYSGSPTGTARSVDQHLTCWTTGARHYHSNCQILQWQDRRRISIATRLVYYMDFFARVEIPISLKEFSFFHTVPYGHLAMGNLYLYHSFGFTETCFCVDFFQIIIIMFIWRAQGNESITCTVHVHYWNVSILCGLDAPGFPDWLQNLLIVLALHSPFTRSANDLLS